MALVKPDVSDSGGSTIDTSQKIIYITWDFDSDSMETPYTVQFSYKGDYFNVATNLGRRYSIIKVPYDFVLGQNKEPIKGYFHGDSGDGIISKESFIENGKIIEVGEYSVQFFVSEEGYSKGSLDIKYKYNGNFNVTPNIYRKDSITKSENYFQGYKNIYLQKWNSNYFLKDISSLQYLIKDNKEYKILLFNSLSAIRDMFIKAKLAKMPIDFVGKYKDNYYTYEFSKKIPAYPSQIKIKIDPIGWSDQTQYTWTYIFVVRKQNENDYFNQWVDYDVYYRADKDTVDYTGLTKPANRYYSCLKQQNTFNITIEHTMNLTDCIGLVFGTSYNQTFIPTNDNQVMFLNDNFFAGYSSSDSFSIPESLPKLSACKEDLVYDASKSRLSINSNYVVLKDFVSSITFDKYVLNRIEEHDGIRGYLNFYNSNDFILQEYCNPTAILCNTYNITKRWGLGLVRNVEPNTPDTPYKYKITLASNGKIVVSRSNWNESNYTFFTSFNVNPDAKRFIIDVQAAGGSGASTDKMIAENRQYPNGGGGGGAFVRLLVNLEDGDLYIGLEKTYIADDNRDSKHYTWINYLGKDSKEIRINLGNGGMGQLQSIHPTNGIGGRVNFEQGVNPNTDEKTFNNLTRCITNFNYLNENKIKIIHCYYGKSAPEGIKADYSAAGKFNGANGGSFIEKDILNNLDGTTTQILHDFGSPYWYARGKGGISQDASNSAGGGGGGASVLGFGLNGKTRREQDNNTNGDETNGFGGGGGGGVSLKKGNSGPVTGYWGQHGCFIIYW